VDNCQVGSYLG
jgi:SRSO17 transposase